MKRRYWLDLFTGNTWEEFIKSEATVTGFRKRRHKLAKHIKPGDYFLCYITGISRFAGVLEAKSECYIDESNNIWKNEDFPVRFDVEFIYKLTPETGIYIQDLNDKLSIFKDRSSPRAWTAQFRGSPAEFNQDDGEIIVEEIKKAVINPVKREYNKKKYLRTPKTYDTKIGVVTVPEEDEPEPQVPPEENKLTHEDIQGILLKLGSDLGLDIWVARNDRNKTYCGRPFWGTRIIFTIFHVKVVPPVMSRLSSLF